MKPYRVLIADDEHYIRQRIIKIFPWDRLPLELAGEAENGSQVLKLMETGIDIIVLDIKMPFLDGLEAAGLIYRQYPETKVIILSGYDNFSYAQSAMRYGVVEYILKPVEKETLFEVVSRTVALLTQEREQKEERAELNNTRRHQVYQDMLAGKMKEPALALLAYGEMKYGLFIGFYLPAEHTDRADWISREFNGRELNRLKPEINLPLKYEMVRENDNAVLFHFFLHMPEEGTEVCEMAKAMAAEAGLPLYCSLGAVFRLDEGWQGYYRAVLHGLLNRYFTTLPAWGSATERGVASPLPCDIMKIRQRVVYFVNTRNSQGYEAYLDRLLAVMAQNKDSRLFKQAMEEWCATLSLLDQPSDRAANYRTLIEILLEEEYQLEGVRAYLAASGSRLIEQKDLVPSDIAVCRKVTAYIEEHYTDPAFNVGHVAEHLGMNISYLGSIFKRVRQLSINQCITLVRMDAAAALLQEKTHRVSEIAEQVGYGDVFYFSKRFKGVYGVSPREYMAR